MLTKARGCCCRKDIFKINTLGYESNLAIDFLIWATIEVFFFAQIAVLTESEIQSKY